VAELRRLVRLRRARQGTAAARRSEKGGKNRELKEGAGVDAQEGEAVGLAGRHPSAGASVRAPRGICDLSAVSSASAARGRRREAGWTGQAALAVGRERRGAAQ
jgi:hypothetical protein